jgi:hypothetical protein
VTGKGKEKNKRLHLIEILVFVIITGYLLFAFFPFILIGPPCDLYVAHNFDTEDPYPYDYHP